MDTIMMKQNLADNTFPLILNQIEMIVWIKTLPKKNTSHNMSVCNLQFHSIWSFFEQSKDLPSKEQDLNFKTPGLVAF